MTPQEINIACAELRGFKNINPACLRGHLEGIERRVPDYCADSNAADELCEAMADNGWLVTSVLYKTSNPNPGYHYSATTSERVVRTNHVSRPMAVALLFLKTRGQT